MHGPRGSLATILAVLASLVLVPAGSAFADGGGSGSGAWPAGYPLPTHPGTVISQSSATAVVRSTDDVATVLGKLDYLYVSVKGCSRRLAVNRPRDYLCFDGATGKTGEVYFTFAALDPTATDPSRSQSNAFLDKG
jgi:hypothetical protein